MYGLVALGLALAFGVLKVLNVAHGELLMLGGYAAFFAFTTWGLDPFVSLPLVFAALFALGVVLYQVLFRFVTRFDVETRIKNSLLLSFGLVLILQALAVRFFTADERTISTSYSSMGFTVGLVRIPLVRLAGLGSMRGLVLAGLFLGLIESLAAVWVGGPYREVVALVVFILVLSLRPQGFFGRAHV
jgi:branched-chain amino acid transport system permease protein